MAYVRGYFGSVEWRGIELVGHQLYYNFIKPHEGLNGLTPSEQAGIMIEGNNKWLTLMKTSLSYKRYKESC